MIRRCFPTLLLLGAACADLPRDSAGTSDRVSGSRMTVGIVANGEDRVAARQLARAIATRVQSQPREMPGSGEEMLVAVEAGRLDLVVGTFDAKTPWATRLTFSEPLKPNADGTEVKAVTRNGEHRWAMHVQSAVDELAKAGR